MGIGPGINRRELEQIAMNDPNFVVQATSFDTLKDKLEEIRLDSCQGWHIALIYCFIQSVPIIIKKRFLKNVKDGGKFLSFQNQV